MNVGRCLSIGGHGADAEPPILGDRISSASDSVYVDTPSYQLRRLNEVTSLETASLDATVTMHPVRDHTSSDPSTAHAALECRYKAHPKLESVG